MSKTFIMFLVLLVAAFAASADVMTASAATNGSTLVTMMRTQTRTGSTRPSPAVRWSGNCENYCSQLFGNAYYPCMELCEMRLGRDTDTDEPRNSDFVGDGEAPFVYVTTDTPSTSDMTDYHHKRGLSAGNGDAETDTDGPAAVPAEAQPVLDSIQGKIQAYADTYTATKLALNTVEKQPAHTAPLAVGSAVNPWIATWLLDMHRAVSTRSEAEVAAQAAAFVSHVQHSRVASPRYFARRLEALGRKQVRSEVRAGVGGLEKGARRAVEGEVRRRWGAAFGERVWAPRDVMGAVDFEVI